MSNFDLSAPPEAIANASRRLGVVFPAELEGIWHVANGVVLPSGWRVYPVFDEHNPRKTAGDIVHENTRGRWPTMAPQFLAIAGNDFGNQLVLEIEDGVAGTRVLAWNHETAVTRPWSRGLETIMRAAQQRVAKIHKKRTRRAVSPGRAPSS